MNKVILVGTGPMAIDYVNVLKALEVEFIVVGRGEKSAKEFHSKTGVLPLIGGIEIFFEKNQVSNNTCFIISTGTEALMTVLLEVVKNNFSSILIEKPGAISIRELIKYEKDLIPFHKKIFIAYNRRFYSSVYELEKLVKEDDGMQSMFFEFTEWSHKIEPLIKPEGVKENWFFANSTHVIDLSFFLAGTPLNWKAFSRNGNLTWHKKTNYVGAGYTDKNVLFSYISNWESAGRWSIEILTKNRRLFLRPLEKISIQEKGSIIVEEHLFDDEIDQLYKPGLYKQISALLNENYSRHINILEHIEMTRSVYDNVLNGHDKD
jgi:predicted dehydrogenase